MNAKIALVARYLLGLALLIFGVNKFINFLPPPELGPEANAFFAALINSGYLFGLIAIVEIAAGLSLLLNRYVALGPVILAPVSINIALFHIFLAPEGLFPGVVITILNFYLLFVNKPKFDGVLSAN